MHLFWLSLAVTSLTWAAPVVKIVGERHKLALRSDGTVVGWGVCNDGQLGPGTCAGERVLAAGPLTLVLPAKAIDVAAFDDRSFLLLEDGTVLSFGGPAKESARVNGMTGIQQIAAGGKTLLGLRRDGSVLAWGSRQSGMVGDGRHPKRYGETGPAAMSPVSVPNVSNVKQISASHDHVLALTSDGRVLAWGSNHFGALGRAPRQELPIDAAGEVPGLTGVIAIVAGNGVSTALKSDGTVWVWGANWHGQFGNGERTNPPGMDSGYELVPQKVAGIAGVVEIAVGLTGRHTLVRLKDGTVRGWGNTDWGQIGAGVASTFQERPVTPRISGVSAIFAAGNDSFAVKADGSLWIWGSGDRGSWPLEKNTSVPVPLPLP